MMNNHINISLIIDFLGDANPRNKQSFNNLTRYNNNVVCNNFCPTTHRHRRVVKRAAVLPNKEPPPLNRIGKTSLIPRMVNINYLLSYHPCLILLSTLKKLHLHYYICPIYMSVGKIKRTHLLTDCHSLCNNFNKIKNFNIFNIIYL